MRKSGEERREEIALAALEIMGEHGTEGTTVERIAESIGITHGALYRHYESREAILAAAAAEAVRRSQAWLDGVESPEPIDQLRELVRKHASFARQQKNVTTRTIFQLLASIDRPAFESQRNMERWPVYQRFVEIATEAKQQGALRSDVDPKDIAWAVLMFAFNQDMALLMRDDKLADEILVRNMMRLLDSFCLPEPS